MNAFPSHVRTVEDLRGPAGRLEALLNTGRPDAQYAALVCHPHPAGGGTMHNKVVYHAMKALSAFGLPVLRFNFRGVGLSEGGHGAGAGEREDVKAAVEYLERSFSRPIVLAGFSFGSHVGLSACCGDPRVRAMIAVGLPVRVDERAYTYSFLERCTQPKLFVSGDHDPYGPVDELERIWALAAEPKRTRIISGADHFFQGVEGSPGAKLGEMQREIRAWVSETLGLTAE